MTNYPLMAWLQSYVTRFLSTHADRQDVDISVTVCKVTDFSGQDKSDVKFCTVIHGRYGQRISHFGELCSPEAQNRTNHLEVKLRVGKATVFNGMPINVARCVDVGSACVDIRLSPKTDVLV